MSVNVTTACDGCGKALDVLDEPKDLAHVSDLRHYCPACRFLYCPAPTPTRPVSNAFADELRRRRGA